jgi:uncharacterized protein YbbC (DUF1343 family)
MRVKHFCIGILISGTFMTAQAKARADRSSQSTVTREAVATGIDVLENTHFAALRELASRHSGKLRIALMTDQAGLDRNGRRTIDVLVQDATAQVPGLSVTTLFSPEHGINGILDTTNIGNDRDVATGLPVISLFGATVADRHPTVEQLKDLDAVLIDLQDVGVHFYTYETVVGFFLETGAKTGTETVVLDRPNAINGISVQGPVSTPGRENYINYMSQPVRQGLTMGELAQYFNTENHLNAPLTVVKTTGWQRSEWFDETGLMWTNPSPNLRNLTETILYPGIGMLERTNISVGRGTDTPFERIGAPWIDGRKLSGYLNARAIPGVRFMPVHFTPGDKYPYHGQICQGIEMLVTDRNALNSPELGVEVASALWKLFPQQYQVDALDRLILNQATVDAVKSGTDPRKIAESWQADIKAYQERRAKYLLY